MEDEASPRDPEYRRALQEAVSQGVAFGIEVIACGEERAPPTPVALVTQSRIAARYRISLDMVVRRYVAGQVVLGNFILEESAQIDGFNPELLRRALGEQAGAFEQILAIATEEYRREEELCAAARDHRLINRARRLLDGEPVDTSFLDYDLGIYHLGFYASSPSIRQSVRGLAIENGFRTLILSPCENEVWAWVGSRSSFDSALIDAWMASLPPGVTIGVGEGLESLHGWRRTHQQARAAFSIASASGESARYANVALLSTAVQDPLLVASLAELYLFPLRKKPDDGHLLSTLRAYFAADRNSVSAAAALGVSRQTISNRLRSVEERLGQPVSACIESLKIALQLEELGCSAIDDRQ
jgi:PucR C-terminal helix-turn-helix domain/GGDEF-like domain